MSTVRSSEEQRWGVSGLGVESGMDVRFDSDRGRRCAATKVRVGDRKGDGSSPAQEKWVMAVLNDDASDERCVVDALSDRRARGGAGDRLARLAAVRSVVAESTEPGMEPKRLDAIATPSGSASVSVVAHTLSDRTYPFARPSNVLHRPSAESIPAAAALRDGKGKSPGKI